MSQHDSVVANAAGATVRADINSALAALFSNHSGATDPATAVSFTAAYQFWADTTTGLLKIRNAANTGWVTIGTLATIFLGLADLATAQTFTAGQRGQVTTLSDGANISIDLDSSNNFIVTLAGNRTLDNPSNMTAGQSGHIIVVQDGTGSRTLAFGSYYKFPGGTAPTLTTTASAVDVLSYVCKDGDEILIQTGLAFS